jgi:uncharacterized DUF497 family protein
MEPLWRLLVVIYTDRGNKIRLISARLVFVEFVVLLVRDLLG